MLGRLKDLSNLSSVSGNEREVRKYIKEYAGRYGETYVDTMGNLYVHKPGRGKVVMACAHMDEVGMMVKGITKEGLLAYDEVGIDSRVCVSKRVLVGPNRISGVIGTKAIHLQDREDLKKAIKHSELYIDIGAESEEDALRYVSIGDYVSFDTEFERFGDDKVKGKALDDRVGCTVVMELLKNEYDCDFYGVFTVQEEVGTRGAMAAAYQVQPDVALIFEGTTANDMDTEDVFQFVTKVGNGPAISMMDKGTIVKRSIFEEMVNTARDNSIPYQIRQGTLGGNDAGAIHKSGTGALAIGLSVPCRYIHGPVAVCSADDIENTYRLADAFLSDKRFNRLEV